MKEVPTQYYSRDSGQRLCVHIKLNFYVTVLHFITPLIATIFQNYAIAHVRFLCLQFNYSNFIRNTTQFPLCEEYGVYGPIFLYSFTYPFGLFCFPYSFSWYYQLNTHLGMMDACSFRYYKMNLNT